MQCVRVYTQVVRDAVGESHRPVADNVCHATRDKHSATSSPEREGTVRREPRLPDLSVSLNATARLAVCRLVREMFREAHQVGELVETGDVPQHIAHGARGPEV